MTVESVDHGASSGGRVEVWFTVRNDSDEWASPSCMVRAFDADGVRVGSDRIGDGAPVGPGKTDVYTAVTGVDAAGVAAVEVEC